MKILAIGAHPDDIEIGCGATLLKYSSLGHKIHLMVMTEGQKGGHAEERHKEQRKSARILKPADVMWGRYHDTELPRNLNHMIVDIEKMLKKIEPDFILVNHGEDTHQDHRELCKAAVSATRYVKNVLFYEVPTTQNFTPSVFVDIKDTIEGKIAMLMAHKSQITKTHIEGLSIVEIAKSTAVFRGIQGRVQFAEAFLPLRLFINVQTSGIADL